MEFPRKLRELRLKEDLSLKELAVLLKTSASTISKYENGEMLPKIDMMIAICSVLNCTPNQILGLSNENALSPLTKECASIIESMTGTQKQWIYLVIDGVKNSLGSLERSFRLRDDFIKPKISTRIAVAKQNS